MNKPQLPPLPDTPPGLYLHHKGKHYEVMGAARHSETEEVMVVYRPVDGDGSWWVRPHGMFYEPVSVAGVMRPRFERVEKPAQPTA